MRQQQTADPGRRRTAIDKIWDSHRILERDGQRLMLIDRHFIHEGSRRAFEVLSEKQIPIAYPGRTFAAADHYAPTVTRDISLVDPERRTMLEMLASNTEASGIRFFGLDDSGHGILHVIGPEQALTQPGMFIACGDSHTSTHGAMGAFAIGVGVSEVAHVLATQTLWLRKPKTFRIAVEGAAQAGVSAKDAILYIISKIGVAGATGHAVEFTGSYIRNLSIEGRLTICNMTIEAGARSGMVAPDETTFAFLEGRRYAPKGAQWEASLVRWRSLSTDEGAVFDKEITFQAEDIAPMVSWGTSPEDTLPVTGRIPDPDDAASAGKREAMQKALAYMELTPGQEIRDIPVQHVFIGSCTNGRIEDLRTAAAVLSGRKVASGLRVIVVPGSKSVKDQAEAEGLHEIVTKAGAEWRNAGCSMCLSANGDQVPSGERCASTSNRNFFGRQGPGARTHLVSPAMAAAAAVTGRLSDVRTLLRDTN